jgi:hypothetical protein
MRVGIGVVCKTCGHTKQPRGRSAPLGSYFCDSECLGFYEDPKPGDLWPGETEEDFGYPITHDATKEVEK